MNDELPGDRTADRPASPTGASGSPGTDGSDSPPGGGEALVAGSAGHVGGAVPAAADEERVERRAVDLLPEEQAAGSADPEAQAAAILAESDEREADLEASPSSFLEHRTSGQTMPSGESTR